METIHLFTDAEAAMGARHANALYGCALDKSFLRQIANLALEKIKKEPRPPFHAVMKEVMPSVPFPERPAYSRAIAKMFSERNILRRRKIAA